MYGLHEILYSTLTRGKLIQTFFRGGEKNYYKYGFNRGVTKEKKKLPLPIHSDFFFKRKKVFCVILKHNSSNDHVIVYVCVTVMAERDVRKIIFHLFLKKRKMPLHRFKCVSNVCICVCVCLCIV
jgi:hypothetical protein